MVADPEYRDLIERLVHDAGLSMAFPPDAQVQADKAASSPGFDDPSLTDRRALPFVTIDNADSRDLDQALYIEAKGSGGFVVYYALADASHYVPRHSPLFVEALARGASYYLPGFVVPMLPAVLSEGVVSLNPKVERRALVFVITLDAAGAVESTEVERALIESRAKLTYDGVQEFMDDPGSSPIAGTAYEPSMWSLREVGLLRIQRAKARGVVQYNRVGVTIHPEEGRWTARADLRNDVEKYNEQISLLCNSQGAELLARSGLDSPFVEPVFKVHPAPDDGQWQALASRLAEIAAAHGLGAQWIWNPEAVTLAKYVRDLPRDSAPRVAQAIERQCMIAGAASRFSSRKGCHFGVGAQAYGRFTAPMREIVGVFTHHETMELIQGSGVLDEALRQQVVEAANTARNRQRQLTKAVHRIVLDTLFDEAEPEVTFTGTVLGARRDRLYVQLDTPPLEVKVYLGAEGDGGYRLGDEIHLRVDGVADARWKLTPVQR